MELKLINDGFCNILTSFKRFIINALNEITLLYILMCNANTEKELIDEMLYITYVINSHTKTQQNENEYLKSVKCSFI